MSLGDLGVEERHVLRLSLWILVVLQLQAERRFSGGRTQERRSAACEVMVHQLWCGVTTGKSEVVERLHCDGLVWGELQDGVDCGSRQTNMFGKICFEVTT